VTNSDRPVGRISSLFLAVLLWGGLALALVACDSEPEAPETAEQAPSEEPEAASPEAEPELVLTETGFEALPGWTEDDPRAAAEAFLRSCGRFKWQDEDRQIGPDPRFGTVGDWLPACAAVRSAADGPADAVRSAFEATFVPYWIASSDASAPDGPGQGLFTGYFEPELNGSRSPTETHDEPLYPRPSDLVLVDLGNWRDSLRGERIAGRVIDGRLKPYDSRAEIDAGALADKAEPIVWLDSAIDAFFLHIQGSGLVKLTDGSRIRVGYDGHNGHVYHAVGRTLIDWGEVKREDMSLQAIRDWLNANPERMRALMHENPSYIFFRELSGDGPVGAQGVALTPGRSLAIDRRYLPLGAPMMVDVDYADETGGPLRRLMVAQDTGGAIRGVVRADVFWGSGKPAEELAGPMAARGRYWILLPKGVGQLPAN